MATVNELSATARPKAGKGAARAVRREGRVPAVIYGDGKEPIGISLDFKELKHKIYAGHFLTTVCSLDVDGTKHRVIPRDFQLDPVMDNPIHVDFLRLGEGAMVRVRVPIRAKNADQAPGIKRGGTVNIVTHTIAVGIASGLTCTVMVWVTTLTVPPRLTPGAWSAFTAWTGTATRMTAPSPSRMKST